jgi:hypothetical protein
MVDDQGEPFKDYRKDAAQAAQAAAYDAGEIPLLARQLVDVEACAAAVLAHPEAGPLLAPGAFEPEVTLIWQHPTLPIWCRAMVDAYAPDLFVDLKTTGKSTSDRAVGKTIAEYRYDQQEAHYEDGALAVLGEIPPFVFIFVDVDAPHLVSVRTIPGGAIDRARARNLEAATLWAWCQETGEWPGWPEGIRDAELPRWFYRPELDEGWWQ